MIDKPALPPGVPILVPIEEHEADDASVWIATYINWKGDLKIDVRAEVNHMGGVCDCCSLGGSVESMRSDSSVALRPFRVEYTEDSEVEEKLRAVWAMQKQQVEEREEVRRAEALRLAREKGTPVLDRLKARKRMKR